jgi:hypothetical protein
MDVAQLRMLGAGIFFLFIFLSGFWLSRVGKPYNALRFNLHKFIGLAMGVFLIMTVYRMHQVAPLGALEITVTGITVLLFVINVIAGGLLSIDKPMPGFVAWVHKLLPYLIMLSTAVTLYLLLDRRL